MLLNASAQLKFLNSHGSEGSNADRSKTSLFCGVPQYPYQLSAGRFSPFLKVSLHLRYRVGLSR
jgi:hypothetical protein